MVARLNIKAIDKYLKSTLLDSEFAALANWQRSFQQVLITPVCDEEWENIERLTTASRPRGQLLVVIHLNHKEDSQPAVKSRNRNILNKAANQARAEQLSDRLWAWGLECGGQCLLIDSVSAGFELPKGSKSGVGLARKIAVDLALYLFRMGSIAEPYFYMTDADTRLPKDYFTRKLDLSYGCWVFPFEHFTVKEHLPHWTAAMHLYDCYLHYLSRQLSYCGAQLVSPTIGSLIVCRFDIYSMVRGFPLKEATEDFHFLNKVIKITRMQTLQGEPIKLEARPSRRVPIGTGTNLVDMSAKLTRKDSIWIPNSKAFALIKEVNAMISQNSWSEFQENLKLKLEQEHPLVFACLEILKVLFPSKPAWERHSDDKQKFQMWQQYFDTFKQIRLVNRLRDLDSQYRWEVSELLKDGGRWLA